ncbi:MAG: DUF1311 domain-containing protein [Rhodopseudomonas sp.]|nr:DUF1311 domain-containing protein [Rhodopseudomonas sp.]
MRWVAAFVILLMAGAAAAAAQPGHQAVDDSRAVQDCLKTAAGPDADYGKAERCIGMVSNPCLDSDKTKSTADMNACIDRERAVWDDILNETYRQLGEKLDAGQKTKLRAMQRAWIASRDATCQFYWDFYQGTMASPMAASCVNRETARRALFLLGFLYADK